MKKSANWTVALAKPRNIAGRFGLLAKQAMNLTSTMLQEQPQMPSNKHWKVQGVGYDQVLSSDAKRPWLSSVHS